MANDIIVSEMTSASQINTNDLMIMTQPDLQAETGYSTKKGTVLQVANKMLKGTEYLTDLPDFTDKTVLGGLEELKGDLTALLPVDMASGAIANFDTDLSLPLVDCKANIVASQPSGTPTPSSPLAITGYTGMNLTRCGVNLWDEEWELGSLSTANGGKVVSTTTIRSKNNIEIKYGVRYSFIKPNTPQIFVLFYDENDTALTYVQQTGDTATAYNISALISANNTVVSFTPPTGTKYILFRVDNTTTYTSGISINYPSTDTDYHAYNTASTTYPVSWQDEAGTVYGGNLDLTTGVLTVTYTRVNLGDCSWIPSETNDPNIRRMKSTDIVGLVDLSARTDLLCSCYDVKTATETYTRNTGVSIDGSGNIMIYDPDYNQPSSAPAFTTAMAGQYLIFKLATPVTYQLTPVQVQALLGVNNVYNDTNGDTEVKYKEGIQHYIDKKIAATQALIL